MASSKFQELQSLTNKAVNNEQYTPGKTFNDLYGTVLQANYNAQNTFSTYNKQANTNNITGPLANKYVERFNKYYSQPKEKRIIRSNYYDVLRGYGVDPSKAAGVQNFEKAQAEVNAAFAGADRSVTSTKYGLGNIDLTSRPRYQNEDGTYSTVDSTSFNEDGKEVLVPTVIQVNGEWKHVTPEEAWQHYQKTGEYLGKFDTVEDADAYAEQLHNDQEQMFTLQEVKDLEQAYNEARDYANQYSGVTRGELAARRKARDEAYQKWQDALAEFEGQYGKGSYQNGGPSITSGSYDLAKQYQERADNISPYGNSPEEEIPDHMKRLELDDIDRQIAEAKEEGDDDTLAILYEMRDSLTSEMKEEGVKTTDEINDEIYTARYAARYANQFKWDDIIAAAYAPENAEVARSGLRQAEEDYSAYLENISFPKTNIYEPKQVIKTYPQNEAEINFNYKFDRNEKIAEAIKNNDIKALEKLYKEQIPEEYRDMFNVVVDKDGTPHVIHNGWTNEQQMVFGYLYSTDREKAKEYARQINDGIEADLYRLQNQNVEANEKNLGGWAKARAYSIGSVSEFAHTLLEYLTTGTVESNPYMTLSQIGRSIDSAISQDLNDKYGTLPENWWAIGGKGVGDVYQMANSILESTIAGLVNEAGPLGKLASGAMFFGSAADAAFYEAIERGATPGQAVSFGIASGFFECFFEEVSIEKVKGIARLTELTGGKVTAESVLKYLRAAGVSFLTEASEEINTSLADMLAEAIILQNKSESTQKILYYMENEGLSADDAWLKVFKENCSSVAYDGIVGGLSGMAHFIGGTGARAIYKSTAYNGGPLQTGINNVTIPKGTTASNLIDYASQYGDQELAAEMKDKMDARAKSGKPGKISKRQAEQLAASITPETYKKGKRTQKVDEIAKFLDEDTASKGGVKAETKDIALKLDGKDYTVQDIGYGNKREVRLKDAEGNTTTKSIDEVFDQLPEQTRTLIKWADNILGDNAARAVYLYDGSQTVGEYVAAMNAATAVAAGGAKIEKGGDYLLSTLSNKQIAVAQTIGDEMYKAAQADTEKRVKQYAAAKEAADKAIQTGDVKAAQQEISVIEESLKYAQEEHDQAVKEMESAEANSKEYEAAKLKAKETQRQINEINDMISEKKSELDKTIKRVKYTKRKAGTVSFAGGTIEGKQQKAVAGPLTKQQQNIVDMVNALADVFNFDYVFYDGDPHTQGAFVQGSGGKIFININSGRIANKYLAASTLSHELTHAMQEYAEDKYNELKKYVIDQIINKRGAGTLNRLVQRELSTGVSADQALDEVVANACSEMLMNSETVRRLAQENSSLFEEVRSRIGDIVQKIQAAFADKDNKREALVIARNFEDLQRIWDDAASAMVENKTNLEIAGQKLTGSDKTLYEIINSNEQYDFGVDQDEINEYVDNAYIKANTEDYLKYAKVDDRLASDVLDSIPTIEDYVHAIRDNDIRHVKISHGEETNEKYPITPNDQKLIPYIVKNYDKVIAKTDKSNRPGLVYVKVINDNLVYYLEAVTDAYGNEKLLVNKQMIKTGIEDIPDLVGLKQAITKKQTLAEFLADLNEIHKAYAQSVYQQSSASKNIIPEINTEVNDYFANISEDNENYLSPDEISEMMEIDPYATDGDMENAEQIVMNLSNIAKTLSGKKLTQTYELMEKLLPHMSVYEQGNWTEERWSQNPGFTEWYNQKHPSLYYPGYVPGKLDTIKEKQYLSNLLQDESLSAEDRAMAQDLLDRISENQLRKRGLAEGKATTFYQRAAVDEQTLKEEQNAIVQKYHPRADWDYQTWINSADDVKTFAEAVANAPDGAAPDYTRAMMDEALRTGYITVYSSHRIRQGTFVTPSRMIAQDYAGGGTVNSKRVKLTDVAWIDEEQGQYANIEQERSSNNAYSESWGESAEDVGVYNLNNYTDAKSADGKTLFQVAAFEHDEPEYRDMLRQWGGMSEIEIDNLFDAVDAAMDVIKGNLEALDYAWEADIDDRGFSPVKPNSDKLYKVSQDFSTLCRKRILQGAIQNQLQIALDRALTREEGIAIRDALMALQEEGKQIEVACALCYVESARMRSPAQIQKFLDNREAVIRDFYAGKDRAATKQRIAQAEADERQKIYDEMGLVKGKGADNTMYDVRDAKTASLKRLPGVLADRIRSAKKAAKAGYQPSAEQQAMIDTANSMSISDFTTPEGLENLAKNYRDLFDAYTSFIRNATNSKGIENDTWWRTGDSAKISDLLIQQMNAENGLRTQSWSDFQVKHLMDYIGATIELATRGAKQHAYTKVADYVDLMGDTGVMINMSLIPTRDFNGTLTYDNVEGFVFKEAMRLRDKYHATAGTICIGVKNEQIRKLLASLDIDYVIPYHHSGMAAATRAAMHIPTWDDYQDFQNEKQLTGDAARSNAERFGTKLLSESDPKWHEAPKFSDWFDLKKAQQIAKQAGKTGKYGVMTGGYAAMQDAAQRYLQICAERGLAPKFSYGRGDFAGEENYWKLLIDRKMIDNVTGNVIEQQKIKPIFDIDTIQRILNDELERYGTVKADQEEATRRVTEAFLGGKIKGGMSSEAIAEAIQKPVDNISITNITQAAEMMSPMNAAEAKEAEITPREQYQRWAESEDQTSMELADNNIAQNRLQVENNELKALVNDLNKQIKELVADAKKSGKKIDDLKRQMKATDVPEVREADARKMASQLVRSYHSNVSVDDIAADIKALGDYLVQNTGEELDYAKLYDMAETIADKVVSEAYGKLEDVTGEKQIYKEIADMIKDRKFWLPENMRGELDVLDGYNAFRKKNFGRFKLGEGGESIDSFYEQMQDTFGKLYFPDVNTQGEMLIVMADIFDQARDEFGNPFAQDQDLITRELANDILGDAISENLRQMAPTFADKQQAKIQALQAKNKARMDALRQQKNERIADVYRKGVAMRQQAVAREQAKRYDQVKALKEHYQQKEQRAAERRSNTKVRTKIRKLVAELNRRLKNPNSKRYVPVEFMQQTVDLLNMINMDTGKSTNLTAELGKLRNMYDSYKNNPTYSVAYDDYVSDMLKELAQKIGDTPISKMTAEQLDAVHDALKSLDYQIRDAVKVRIRDEEYNAYQLSKEMTAETRSVPKAQSNAFTKWLTAHLRSDVMLPRIGGFVKNSTWEKMVDMLNDGQLKQLTILMNLSRNFEDLVNDEKAIRHFTGTTLTGNIDEKDLVDIGLVDQDGKPIKVTHDIMCGIYMDLLNEDNARHFLYGGKTIPDLQKFYTGKGGFDIGSRRSMGIAEQLSNLRRDLAEAKRMGETDRAKQIKDQIELTTAKGSMYVQGVKENIEKNLTAFDKKWIKATQQLMDQDSKRYLNQTTMDVYGIEKANVPNYFPIYTDKNFTNTDFESITRDMNLENAGFMKERVAASNPTYAMGVVDVVNKQINKVAQYSGLMPAIKNFNKVYNKTGAGYSDSLKQALTDKFGKEGTKYVENLIADLTGSRREEGDMLTKALGKLRGNLAQTSLTLNPRVALSQAASYPTAAAELGWGPLMKALAKGGKNGRLISRADHELIAKYSPLLWYRMQGYTDTELGDIKNSNDLVSKIWKKARWATGWIQAVDGAVIGRLWYAAEYWVQDNVKGLKVGTDEYYQEVAKKFNQVIERTQPNYTTMQKAAILRNPNSLTRMFTMFMTQRLQNFNILYNSVARYQRMRADKANGRNGVTAKDVQISRNDMIRAISSQMAQAATYTSFKLLADALLHGLDNYRDKDDDELTVKSVSLQLLNNYIDALVGSFILGSEIYSLIKSIAGIEKWYGLSVNGVDTINDITTDLISTISAWKDYDPEDEKSKQKMQQALMKFAKSGSQAAGIPLNNAIKIGNALINHVQDALNGEFLSFNAGHELDKDAVGIRMVEALQAGDKDKFDTYADTYSSTNSMYSAIDNKVKAGYTAKKQTITKQEAVDLLAEAGEPKRTAEKKVQQWTCELATGIPYDKIDDQFKEDKISEDRAAELYVTYGGMTKADAKSYVQQIKCEKVTGVKYSNIKSEYIAGNLTDAQVKSMLKTYGGKTDAEATKTVLKYSFEKETEYSWDDRAEALANKAISDSKLSSYLQKISPTTYSTKEKADNYVRYLHFQHDYPRYADLSESNVREIYEAKSATSLTMQQSIDYQIGLSKCKGTDKDGDGKTDTNSLRDAKIKYILSLPYDYNTKLALFKLNYSSDAALKAFKQAAGK